MRRVLAGSVVAGAVTAAAAAGQVWLGRWSWVLVPDQAYEAGNDTWPFQLVLLAWYSASAALLGTRETVRIAYDRELADRIRAMVYAELGLTGRCMFGGLALRRAPLLDDLPRARGCALPGAVPGRPARRALGWRSASLTPMLAVSVHLAAGVEPLVYPSKTAPTGDKRCNSAQCGFKRLGRSAKVMKDDAKFWMPLT